MLCLPSGYDTTKGSSDFTNDGMSVSSTLWLAGSTVSTRALTFLPARYMADALRSLLSAKCMGVTRPCTSSLSATTTPNAPTRSTLPGTSMPGVRSS